VEATRRFAIVALLFCLAGQGFAIGDLQETTRKRTPTLTLTNDRPTGSFPVAPETLGAAPGVVSVSISEVSNPEKTPFEVLVYFSTQTSAHAEPRKILIGNFSLYPPDQPAGFLLSTSQAFRELQAEGPLTKSASTRLLVEIKRIHENKPWTPLAITIPLPKWRDDNPR
jgi:hypothetical protein